MNRQSYDKKISFWVIALSIKGDSDAVDLVIKYYSAYINALSLDKYIDFQGNTHYYVNETTRQLLIEKLILKIVEFEL